ncbi:MAG: phage tail protein I [Anaerolineaceae bacterium]|nr:phage tail protein I [Anaerolineaceae bacterium]
MIDNQVNEIDGELKMTIFHVADFYNRYPGEEVNLHTIVSLDENLKSAILSVALPEGLELIDFSIVGKNIQLDSYVRDLTEGQVIDFHLGTGTNSGEQIEIITRARVLKTIRMVYLVSIAELLNKNGELLASESLRLAVHPWGAYINYLPEIYHGNDFLGRYLMLFESFWKPINQQINLIDLYFDPNFTPSAFLPWLASWLGVTWDDSLPENRKRKLLQLAVSLYQRRGTQSALKDYLQVYSEGEIEIIEHRSQNFILGHGTKLGAAIALGNQNLPHTFSVNINVDEEEVRRMDFDDPSRNKETYIQKLEEIIEQQKPAHTAFSLNLDVKKSNKATNKIGQ